MPIYLYKGRNVRGEAISGSIDSPDARAVANWLMSAGIHPVKIELRLIVSNRPEWMKAVFGDQALSSESLQLFTRQLGLMFKAGVPVMQALAGIEGSSEDPIMVRVIRQLRADLDRGLPLSVALGRHPRSFNAFYVGMVRAGESTGMLDKIFIRLLEQIRFEREMNRQIKSALRYPMFVLAAMVVALVVLSIFVIPIFSRMFISMKMDLPLATRLLINFSQFMIAYWWSLFALAGLALGIWSAWVRTDKGRYRWDRFRLKVPVLGPILRRANMARFAFTFSVGSSSGVPLLDTLDLCGRASDNAFFSDRIGQMRFVLQRGDSVLRATQTSGLFQPLDLQMIAAGEASGELDSMMLELSETYQNEVSSAVKAISQSIEPIMMSFLALIVLVLLLGIFVPLWDMGQMAKR